MAMKSHPGALEAMVRAEVKSYQQAMCHHDWQPDVRGGYSCPRCESWTAELMRIPLKRAK